MLEDSIYCRACGKEVLRSFLFLWRIITNALVVRRRAGLFLRKRDYLGVLCYVFREIVEYFPTACRWADYVVINGLELSSDFRRREFGSFPRRLRGLVRPWIRKELECIHLRSLRRLGGSVLAGIVTGL